MDQQLPPRARVQVLHGSESGNAAELAEILGSRLREHGLEPKVSPFGSVTLEKLQHAGFVLIVCSTTGQGALPRNTQPLWPALLKSALPADVLQHVEFSSFGIGDNAYKRFNWAVRKIHARFLQLGATQFVDRSEGDEQSTDSVEATFDQWSEAVIDRLSHELGLSGPNLDLLPPRYELQFLESDQSDRSLLQVEVKANQRMTASDHFQDVRHLTLDIPAVSYRPGAYVYLYPCNIKAHVDALIESQGWQDVADKPITVDETWLEQLPRPCISPLTLRTFFTWLVDLNGVPRRSFFKLAAFFCEGNEAERLQEFSSTEGLEDLYNYANRPRRSLIEAIIEFDTLKIPIEYILDLFPPMWPRAYSIASSGDNEAVDLCVALVKYKTAIRRVRRGVCSTFIENLKPGDLIGATMGPAQFDFVSALGPDQPVILVAAGTGVSPIRSTIHSLRGRQAPMFLFFGCRFADKDYLYSQEWQQVQEDTNLTVITAFSRQGGGYVQQKIEEHESLITAHIPSALIYVCGSSGSMPQGVRESFVQVLHRTRGIDLDRADQVISYKEKHNTYIEESW